MRSVALLTVSVLALSTTTLWVTRACSAPLTADEAVRIALQKNSSIVLSEGFIWSTGKCGVGDFQASAEGVSLSFKDTNWIFYEFDWSNSA